MASIRTIAVHIFFIYAGLYAGFCSAQSGERDLKQWAVALADKSQQGKESFTRLDTILQNFDSLRCFQFLDQLANQNQSRGHHFIARFNCLKARHLYLKKIYGKTWGDDRAGSPVKDEVKKLMAVAMDHAYRSEDDYLITFTSSWYAINANYFNETGLCVMYAMQGIDLGEKISYPIWPYDYQFLAELLYRVREYNSSINYALKAVNAWSKSTQADSKIWIVSCLNTVALGYHRQQKLDSAFIYYQQALQLAKELKRPVWVGIVSGNMGQAYYAQGRYDTAWSLLVSDYKTSSDSSFFDNAANSLQWAGRVSLAMGNKTKALSEVRGAFGLLKLWPDAGYLRNSYYTITQIFQEMGAYDSAFYYNNLYVALNDSLEKIVSRSSSEISQARLNDEASRYSIQSLNREKKNQLLLRNIIIAGIVLLSLIALLVINRQRLKARMKMEKVEQEKQLIEREAASARAQLKMFTENIIEKTSLIEKLESQIKGKESSADQQVIISELGRQTILTEEDWTRFKSLFEKIYPGFFINLKNKLPDITIGEQRMAALTRLRLTTKQMASMLGISDDSVHKSRQRLRQRFQVGIDANLDELVAKL